MNKIQLLLTGVFVSSFAFGQTVKIQAGTTFSKLNWELGGKEIGAFNETKMGYSFLVGVDYLERKFWKLSSNIGMVRKGGQGKLINDDQINYATEQKYVATLDYVTLNTTFDLKYPISEKFTPFISAGPRADFLVTHSTEMDVISSMNELESFNYGLLLGGGVTYHFLNILLGLRADYYLNMQNVAEWPKQPGNLGGKINDQTLSLNMSIGYKL